ncbi:MAG: aldehyde dehydrogenase family protein, partial [Candidatus Omnitrophota bacterium]
MEVKSRPEIINPSNGEVIVEVALASMKDMEAAIASAREAFDSGPWPKLSLSQRKEFLLKISQGI